MPELPEVEVVRAGLAQAVTGARIHAVEVFDVRSLKRHNTSITGASSPEERSADFERRLTGAALLAPMRRGKFLWVPIYGHDEVLLTHLGMSGQLLLRSLDAPDDRHVRVRMWLATRQHGELRLDFADQRLFGSLAIDSVQPSTRSTHTGAVGMHNSIPSQVSHIAPDPLESAFDEANFTERLLARHTAIKRALLDQTLVSGIGNIYADEALWHAEVHPETLANRLSVAQIARLIEGVREVFERALAEGGTSFDAQYVNVNGQSGYFAHSLRAYGQTGSPCQRCGTPIVRVAFMNRSSHFCPTCQRTNV